MGGRSPESIMNTTPRIASAASRAATPASRTNKRPPCSRTDSTVYSPAYPPLARVPRRVEPAANRLSGSSVRTSTTSSPLTPCALTTRPTTRSMTEVLLVGVHHIDADAPSADAGDECAQRGRGAAAASHDLAEIVGMDMYLDRPPAAVGHHIDPNIVGIVHDSANQMLDRVDDDRAHEVISFRFPRRAPPPSAPHPPPAPQPPPAPRRPRRPRPYGSRPLQRPPFRRPSSRPSWREPSSSVWWPRWAGRPRPRPTRR